MHTDSLNTTTTTSSYLPSPSSSSSLPSPSHLQKNRKSRQHTIRMRPHTHTELRLFIHFNHLSLLSVVSLHLCVIFWSQTEYIVVGLSCYIIGFVIGCYIVPHCFLTRDENSLISSSSSPSSSSAESRFLAHTTSTSSYTNAVHCTKNGKPIVDGSYACELTYHFNRHV